jgi:hypothetical protein
MGVKYGVLMTLDKDLHSRRSNSFEKESEFTSGLLLCGKSKGEVRLRVFSNQRSCMYFIESIYRALLTKKIEYKDKLFFTYVRMEPAIVIFDGESVSTEYTRIIGINQSLENNPNVKLITYDEDYIFSSNDKFVKSSFTSNSILFNLNLFLVRKLAVEKIIPFNNIPSYIVDNFSNLLASDEFISDDSLTKEERDIRNKIISKTYDIW